MTLPIHFAGGFPSATQIKNSKRHIRDHAMMGELDLLAIESFHKIYPDHPIYCHTTAGAWLNMPSYATRFEYDHEFFSKWPKWEIKSGAHKSDKVRLHAMIQHGGLYADTDVFALKPIPFLTEAEGKDLTLLTNLVSARGQRKLFCNGVFAAGKPNATFLLAWWDEYMKSPNSAGVDPAPKARLWDGLSGRIPSKMAMTDELAPFVQWEDDFRLIHGLGYGSKLWRKGKAEDLPDYIFDRAYTCHTIDARIAYTCPEKFGHDNLMTHFVQRMKEFVYC